MKAAKRRGRPDKIEWFNVNVSSPALDNRRKCTTCGLICLLRDCVDDPGSVFIYCPNCGGRTTPTASLPRKPE